MKLHLGGSSFGLSFLQFAKLVSVCLFALHLPKLFLSFLLFSLSVSVYILVVFEEGAELNACVQYSILK